MQRIFVACSCEGTMSLNGEALEKGCSGRVELAQSLCRAETEKARALMGAGAPVVIGCTQESPLFLEMAEETGAEQRISFGNIREQAGWSDEGAKAGPKMAALLAAAAEPMPGTPLVTLESRGVTLIYGEGQEALALAQTLSDRLDITLVLKPGAQIVPPRRAEFPIVQGRITKAEGVLGGFTLIIDRFARALPSSRNALMFGPSKDGATSQTDILIDLTRDTPLFSAGDLREGYLRADPGSASALAALTLKAADLVGTFDRPRYVTYEADLCAHSRSRITGCTRCLDLCPTGAITPDGNHVAIDPLICAGCGQCAAACPTGAASYALPPVDAALRRLRTLVTTYLKAGGTNATLLIHDEHGDELIDALARFGQGLPAHVLPFRLNEVTQAGPEFFASAFAWGAARVAVLTRAKPKHDLAGLQATAALSNRILSGLGFGETPVAILSLDDPDQLRPALAALSPVHPSAKPSTFLPAGHKRGLLEVSLRELHRAAPQPVDVIALDKGAPFGGLDIAIDGCTLCLSCVSACPVNALGDNPDKPLLSFDESLCVQCGLCAATCPEKVITLKPQIDFAAWEAHRRVVKEEEPALCVKCTKPFGTKASLDKVKAKLASHWMFSGENAKRADLLMMCDDCRVEVTVLESFSPYGDVPERPRVRTSEDYLRERAERGEDPLN